MAPAPEPASPIDPAEGEPRAVAALVFDVQRFSVHDGPGIRTTVFFKGCPLRCAWCQNGESLRGRAEIAFFAERCRGEGDCVSACPSDAIDPVGADRIRRDRCDGCGRCAHACSHGVLELVGRTVSLDVLLDEVARDAPFYEASGGGVTLSGGEPMRQSAFVRHFVRGCRARGITVVLQTCGAFRFEELEPILDSLELVQMDLKIVDDARHRALTGASNERILANARALVERGAPLMFRMPVIPGHTDGEENLRAIARVLRELGTPRITTLRGHSLGQVKLRRLGFPLEGFPLAPLELGSPAELEAAHARADQILRSHGVEVEP